MWTENVAQVSLFGSKLVFTDAGRLICKGPEFLLTYRRILEGEIFQERFVPGRVLLIPFLRGLEVRIFRSGRFRWALAEDCG